MVVDCGGGTVDITVYEMESKYGCLRELHKATGGPYGSVGEYLNRWSKKFHERPRCKGEGGFFGEGRITITSVGRRHHASNRLVTRC